MYQVHHDSMGRVAAVLGNPIWLTRWENEFKLSNSSSSNCKENVGDTDWFLGSSLVLWSRLCSSRTLCPSPGECSDEAVKDYQIQLEGLDFRLSSIQSSSTNNWWNLGGGTDSFVCCWWHLTPPTFHSMWLYIYLHWPHRTLMKLMVTDLYSAQIRWIWCPEFHWDDYESISSLYSLLTCSGILAFMVEVCS